MTHDSNELLKGRYSTGRLIGEGGMGKVYTARDTILDREVAIKFLKNDVIDEPGVIEGFNYESQLLASLDHPGILPVLDMGVTSDGTPYSVMKVIKGVTLGDELKRHRSLCRQEESRTFRTQALNNLLRIFARLCETVAFVHKKRLIHRDIKPDNVMIDSYGVVLLIDWGLARPISIGDNRPDISKTETGLVKGTISYMSPEQFGKPSRDLDGRSDLFALGIILYEIVLGETPFDAEDLESIVFKVKSNSYIRPENSEVNIPSSLCSIINKALSPAVGTRYQKASELGNDINAFLDGLAVKAHKPSSFERFVNYMKRNPRFLGGSVTIFIVLLLALVASVVIHYDFGENLNERLSSIERVSKVVNSLEKTANEKRKTLTLLEKIIPSLPKTDMFKKDLEFHKTRAHEYYLSQVVYSLSLHMVIEEDLLSGRDSRQSSKILAIFHENIFHQLKEISDNNDYFKVHFLTTLYSSKPDVNRFRWSLAQLEELKSMKTNAKKKIIEWASETYGEDKLSLNWEREIQVIEKMSSFKRRR